MLDQIKETIFTYPQCDRKDCNKDWEERPVPELSDKVVGCMAFLAPCVGCTDIEGKPFLTMLI